MKSVLSGGLNITHALKLYVTKTHTAMAFPSGQPTDDQRKASREIMLLQQVAIQRQF